MIFKSSFIKSGLSFLIVLMLMSGCQSPRKMVYLRKAAKKDSTQIFQQPHKDYNIAVNDVLYVRILTGNPEISALYNNVPASGFSISMSSEADQYINGFTVDKEGKIKLPVLGTVSVEGLTLYDAEKKIQQLADQYLIDATVIVRLLNYKVTVLGEVAQPGVYSHYNDQMTILQAIGKAGDITDLGDKRNIMVIRSVPDGQITYQVDLTQKELLSSPAFFVKPNDVIYVKPSGSKAFRINLPIMSIFLSSLTTVIVLLQYFQNQ